MRKCYTISSNLSKYCCFCVFMGGRTSCSHMLQPSTAGRRLERFSAGFRPIPLLLVESWVQSSGVYFRMAVAGCHRVHAGAFTDENAHQGLFSCPSRDYLKDHEETGHADNLNIQCEASRRTSPQNVLQRSGSCLIIRCRRPCVKARSCPRSSSVCGARTEKRGRPFIGRPQKGYLYRFRFI